MTSRNNRYYYLLALLPFLFLIIMYELLPLIMLIVDSFGLDKDPAVRFSLDNYKKIFTTLSYKTAIKNSLVSRRQCGRSFCLFASLRVFSA